MFDTALNDGAEIITEVRFPKPDKAGYAKFPNPASRDAIVGLMVAHTGALSRGWPATWSGNPRVPAVPLRQRRAHPFFLPTAQWMV